MTGTSPQGSTARAGRSGIGRDVAGNILPIAAAGVLVAAAIIGAAVDMSRNFLAREQLQSACDAAVLAGRRAVTTDGFDQPSEDAARAFFAVNFHDRTQNTHDTDFDVGSPDDGKTVEGTATTTLDTLIMRLFNYDSFNIRVTCASSMGVGNADVVMVLDTTGSMSNPLSGRQTRIQALRAAMKNFYTTMTNATANTSSRIRYGFVPYSTTVNVGRLLNDLDTRFLVDNHTYQSREWMTGSPTTSYTSTSTSDWSTYSSATYSTAQQCQTAKLADDRDFKDEGSVKRTSSTTTTTSTTTDTQAQRKYAYRCSSATTGRGSSQRTYHYVEVMYTSRSKETVAVSRFYYRAVSYNTSAYKGFTAVSNPVGTRGAMVSSRWAGCIEERKTVARSGFSFSSLAGISPSGAFDLDIDSAPDIADDDTKWAPMWPEVSFRRWNDNSYYSRDTELNGGAAYTYCPAASRVLGEMSQSDFDNYANSLVAEGSTYLDIGMIWGGRLLSPEGIFAPLVNEEASNGGEVSRHIIFMTDGQMEPNNLIHQAYGAEYWDRRITSDGSSEDASRHSSRFRAVCEAIKDKGIRIWVVAFTSGRSDDLDACASDSSSYTANSAVELNTAFQEIAKQVGELRVVQ